MAQSYVYLADQPSAIKVTLGTIVQSGDDHGVVWQVTSDMLRVLPVRRGATRVPLPLASEVALHLPASPAGWSITYDQLHTWPRSLCHVVGEVDERCLLRILEARKAPLVSFAPTLASTAMSAAVHHSARSSDRSSP
jgi:hypothetical protein